MRTRVVNIRREACDVNIMRPGPWGNPFYGSSRALNIARHREWVLSWQHFHPERFLAIREQLRGKRLGCVCAPAPCHGDVYAEIANSCCEPNRTIGGHVHAIYCLGGMDGADTGR